MFFLPHQDAADSFTITSVWGFSSLRWTSFTASCTSSWLIGHTSKSVCFHSGREFLLLLHFKDLIVISPGMLQSEMNKVHLFWLATASAQRCGLAPVKSSNPYTKMGQAETFWCWRMVSSFCSNDMTLWYCSQVIMINLTFLQAARNWPN